LPRKIINAHAGRYATYGGFSLKKRLSIVLLVSLALFVAMAQVAPAIAEHQGHETSDEHNEVHQVTFHIDLTGSQQVGPVSTEAFGMATVRLADNGTAIDFRVIVCDIVNVTASHIHVGAAGTNGPVIIPFVHGVLFSSPHGCKTLAEGTRTASDLNTQASPSITSWNDFVKALLAGNTYVNVHTTANPGGEIRGQLVHEHENDQGDD
jgi:CHRD domain